MRNVIYWWDDRSQSITFITQKIKKTQSDRFSSPVRLYFSDSSFWDNARQNRQFSQSRIIWNHSTKRRSMTWPTNTIFFSCNAYLSRISSNRYPHKDKHKFNFQSHRRRHDTSCDVNKYKSMDKEKNISCWPHNMNIFSTI